MADPLSGFAAALLDPARPLPPGVTVRPGADIARRMAVYRNNIVVGLIEALRAGLPVTEAIVGADFFRAMARDFAVTHKPAVPMMFAYGDGFPAFVAGYEAARSVPYLAGVAALEAARTAAHHAADAPALSPSALARMLSARRPEATLASRLDPHPAARLVESEHPIVAIWQAHQGEDQPGFAGPWRPETALVTRPEAEVRVRALDPVEGRFAALLFAGATLAEAGAAGLALDAGFDLGRSLIALAEAGALAGLDDTPTEEMPGS